MVNKKRAVFLDRDGVLNVPVIRDGKTYPPDSLKEFNLFSEVTQSANMLAQSGYLLIVVTNQPDVLRGKQKIEIVEEMHDFLKKELPLDDIFVAWDENGFDYKPKIGMVVKAAKKYNIDLSASYLIGDRWRDIDCGVKAGCFTIFIDRGYKEVLSLEPKYSCSNLLEAAQFIVKR